MEEGSKVRLVRCPKCENLLPELPDFSVYQCGGCGAVLRANEKGPVNGEISEKSEMERFTVDNVNSGGAYNNSESNGLEHSWKNGAFPQKDGSSVDSSSSKVDKRESLNNFDHNDGKESMKSRVNDRNKDEEVGYYDDTHAQWKKPPINNWVRADDYDLNIHWNRAEIGNSRVGNGSKEFKGDFAGSFGSRPTMRRFSTYPDEGPSNYQSGPFHDCAVKKRIDHVIDGPGRVHNLEHDRTELLRKLDELKEQLSRSCDVSEKPRERVPLDRKMVPPPPPPPPPAFPNCYSGHGSYVSQGPTNLYNANVQPIEPLYFNHDDGCVPYLNSHGLDMQDFYPSRSAPSEYVGYEDPYLPQRLRRPVPYQPQSQYLTPPYGNYVDPRQRMELNQNTLPSYHETFSHQPSRSYLQHHNNNWQIPPNVPNPVCNANPFAEGALYYNSRGGNSHPHHLPRGHPRRVVVARGSEQACLPVAGGAPFITCFSCFELLKLPRNVMMTGRNQQRVRCGSCSAIMLIQFEKKGLLVSIPTQLEQVSAECDDSSGELVNQNLQRPDDCDNIGYKFALTDAELSILSEQILNFAESNERQDPLSSSSSSFSEDEQSPDSVIFQKVPDNASSANVISRSDMGNKSKRDDQEKVMLDRKNLRQNSTRDVAAATEMEVSYNEVLNSGTSQDSEEVSKEEDPPRINKGGESFFAGLMKKSFRDSGRPKVSVNGQPLSYRLVKKAEKLAGPIQPGSYWYDYQAGFWGVMGHPCLGIIPPFIEEFNHPMPGNCAAGNTGVFVNGRELHQKDLELLARRGLPTTRDKYYIIEISGRVLDECSGEELDGLGKLAPTVEKAKHGFGMKVPKELAKLM